MTKGAIMTNWIVFRRLGQPLDNEPRPPPPTQPDRRTLAQGRLQCQEASGEVVWVYAGDDLHRAKNEWDHKCSLAARK